MCCGKNVRLKPTNMSQKCHFEPLVEHAPEHLRPPVVEAAEDREDGPAQDHVVEVGDDEVRVVDLPVDGERREVDASRALRS